MKSLKEEEKVDEKNMVVLEENSHIESIHEKMPVQKEVLRNIKSNL